MKKKIEKIIVGYPPFDSDKGVPLLSQNRQFQWFNEPTYIYPVIPATAATMLSKNGYRVIFKDAIAENMRLTNWLEYLENESPDLIFFETKTPVIAYFWDVVDTLKSRLPLTTVVLAGDHVTAFPEETFDMCKVDYILSGGDYDFLLLNLVNHLDKGDELEGGIYYRAEGEMKKTGELSLTHDLTSAPFIDRNLTNWKNYAYNNGNYKRTPGTYIMSGRDCWHHRCTFCSWTTLFNNFRTRKPENVVDEIEILVKEYGIKEIMDDTGCFPVGKWLHEFCVGMLERKLNKRVLLDCNMRFGALDYSEYRLMKKAGFRFVLFGLESANQKTLDRIDKGLNAEEIEESCRLARKAGLYPHITVMFGYPWEDEKDVKKTIALAKRLMIKGYAYTMQATIVIPYPGTPLFKECDKNGTLRTKNWAHYDMRKPIMKGKLSDDDIKRLVQELYSVSFNPLFLAHKILSIRDIWDLAYYGRAFKKVVFGHLKDFS